MKRRKKLATKSPSVELFEDLRDFKHTAGGDVAQKPSVRTLQLNMAALQPHQHTARSVKSTRERLGISQMVFAAMIGASLELIQGWESGTHWPSQMACHLIDAINSHPEEWTQRLNDATKTRRK